MKGSYGNGHFPAELGQTLQRSDVARMTDNAPNLTEHSQATHGALLQPNGYMVSGVPSSPEQKHTLWQNPSCDWRSSTDKHLLRTCFLHVGPRAQLGQVVGQWGPKLGALWAHLHLCPTPRTDPRSCRAILRSTYWPGIDPWALWPLFEVAWIRSRIF